MSVNKVIWLWTIVAVALRLAGVGEFADWSITRWPWHWSCLSVLYWSTFVDVVAVIVLVLKGKDK